MPTPSPPLTKDIAALAAVLATSGVTHLVRPEVFEGMVPRALPATRGLVYASGVVELLCAAGLVTPSTRRAAGWCSAVLLVAVFPANVQMAVDAWQDWSAGEVGTPYAVATLLRLPLQLPLIWWAWRVTRRNSTLPA